MFLFTLVSKQFIIQLKQLFQQLCMGRVAWDNALEISVYNEWNKLLNVLECLSQIRIPRYYLNPNK